MSSRHTEETQGFHDLIDAFAAPGCPVCALSTAAVSRYMRSTNYDGVADPGLRKQFEASLGFCNPHAHQWLAEAFVLSTAQMYRDLVRLMRKGLEESRGSGGGMFGRGKRESGLPTATIPCPACALQERVEQSLVATLVRGLTESALRDAYLASDGCCLPHLRDALTSAGGEAGTVLRQRGIETTDLLLAHLDETVRKHDYRFRHEPAEDEVGSPARAVHRIAGSPGSKAGSKR